MQQVLDRHITIDPAITHGRPHIAGHRIRVQDIAIWHERLGLSADEICTDYDLSLGEVYAALAYYFDHKTEIDQAIDSDLPLVDALRRDNPSLQQARLNELRGR